MKFNYTARTKGGQIQMGSISAASEEAAAALLQKLNLFVTNLEATKEKPFYVQKIKFPRRISAKEVVLFSQQLSILVQSEVPLVEALRTLAFQTKNPEFKEKIMAICEEVEGGTAFSQALSRHPKIFSTFFVNLVKSGEAAGKLSQVLSYLAEHLAREHYLSSKIKGAMFYPAFLLTTLFGVLILMLVFVLPKLISVLEETGAELPLVTRLLIAFVGFLIGKGWIFLVILFLVGMFLWRWFSSEKGKFFLDKYSLRLPFLGNFFKMICLSRFSENLSTLISGGLPISRALEISGDVVGNQIYKEIILKVRDEVRKGEAISSVLSQTPKEIPALFTQMVLVGEKTGKLDAILIQISDFYRKEVDVAVSGILSLIEPVLIVLVGLVIGFFVASVLLPIYSISGGLGE